MTNDRQRYPVIFQIEDKGRTAFIDAEGMTIEGVRYGFGGIDRIRYNKTHDEEGKPFILHMIRMLLVAVFLYLILFHDFPPPYMGIRGDNRGTYMGLSALFLCFCFVPWIREALCDLSPQEHYLLLSMDSRGKKKYKAVLTGFPEEALLDFARAANEARERYIADAKSSSGGG